MIITLEKGASDAQVQEVVAKIEQLGCTAHIDKGLRTVIGIRGDTSALSQKHFEALDGVESVTRITQPFKLVSKEFKPSPSVIDARGEKIGNGHRWIIAGPCSVESEEQILTAARAVKAAGANLLRGSAYKPRTSPYCFQGMGEPALQLLAKAREETGLPIATEIMAIEQIPLFEKYDIDVYQVGARNMQNFNLLKALGKINKPVILKRGLSGTLKEWLLCAEYLMAHGNENVILCERGIRTFETAYRNVLDLNAVVRAKQLSHLPVIVDPSHGTGVLEMVCPMAKAALACGADGILIEVHPNPKEALSDAQQQLTPEQFDSFMKEIK